MARRFRNPLPNVQVASPCFANWDLMIGSDRIRFCGQCNLNVYNLSGMTRNEAESLIARNEGRLCVRFYRRPDGSIITQDCPIGLSAIRRKMSYLTKSLIAAGLAFLAACGLHSLGGLIPVSRPQALMGVMAMPSERDRMILGLPPVAT